MSVQEIFNNAQQKYNENVELLTKFSEIIAEVCEGEFSTEVVLRQFDCILQYLLLHEAIADGNINSLEKQFIELITDTGDILDFANGELGTSFKWDDLVTLSPEYCEKFMQILTPQYAKLLENFLDTIARVDGYIEDIDLFGLINENIIAIFAALAGIDGNATKEEKNRVLNVYYDMFIAYYEQAVQHAEEE